MFNFRRRYMERGPPARMMRKYHQRKKIALTFIPRSETVPRHSISPRVNDILLDFNLYSS